MADDHKETEEPLLLQDGETSDDGAAGGSGGTVYGSDASEADTLDTAEPEDHTIPGKDVAEDSSRTGTIFSSVVNLVNTFVGAGVLSLPFAFNKTGVVVGSTVLLMCYFLMGFSCWLLLECQEQCGDKSYRDIAKAAMGQRGYAAQSRAAHARVAAAQPVGAPIALSGPRVATARRGGRPTRRARARRPVGAADGLAEGSACRRRRRPLVGRHVGKPRRDDGAPASRVQPRRR